ncbi:MAG: MBL fold metallo-hydrolase [Hyphomicrobiales bacterium]|nr:MBL fold metallo-hydrolase [Hyphomicrobiales bacterium]
MKPAPPFNREVDFHYGVLETVSSGLRRIVADNGGPFTFKGTNTYVIGHGEVAVVDPGPDDERHRKALLTALAEKGERVTYILLTHAHPDHSAGIPALKALTGALTLGCGRDNTGTVSPQTPSGKDLIDVHFKPDRRLADDERFRVGDTNVVALHTPGHAPDHLCFALPDAKVMLSGDHVMGWNTSVVAPPEGNMGHYFKSLEKLLPRDETVYFPGHGGRVEEPQRLVKAFIVHRRWREAEIIQCLRDGLSTVHRIVPRIYAQLDSALHGAAALSVYAHIERLHEIGRVQSPGRLGMESEFYLIGD